LARAVATAWRVLTSRLPAQNNGKFHKLLAAGVVTIVGDAAKGAESGISDQDGRGAYQEGSSDQELIAGK
jgi:hypothetical protein